MPIITPSEESILFHMAIGHAVAQWAHVENGLYNVATTAFGGDSPSLGPAFHAIENLRTKIAFVGEAVSHSAAFTDLQPEWAKVRDLVSSLASSKRNKIAHCRTIGYPAAEEGRRYAIVPISYKVSKFKNKKAGPPSGSMCVSDIDQAARQFAMAANLLFDLKARAEGLPEPYGELSRQEPPRQTLAQLARQMRAMLPQPD